MEGRRALLLKLCSSRIHLRAGGQLLSPGQRFYPFRNHKGMEGQSGYQMFCNNSPGVGRKCACISVISKCHICLKPCLCHYQGSPLFSFFSLFFSHFIIFVIILIIAQYFISNTARRPIDMVDQTNPISIHNQENFVPSFDTFCPFAAFQV